MSGRDRALEAADCVLAVAFLAVLGALAGEIGQTWISGATGSLDGLRAGWLALLVAAAARVAVSPARGCIVAYFSTGRGLGWLLVVLLAGASMGLATWETLTPGGINSLGWGAVPERLVAFSSFSGAVLKGALALTAGWLAFSLVCARLEGKPPGEKLSRSARLLAPACVFVLMPFRHIVDVTRHFFFFAFLAASGFVIARQSCLLPASALSGRARGFFWDGEGGGRRGGTRLIIVLIVLFVVLVSLMNLRGHTLFQTTGKDLVLVQKMMESTLQGRFMYSELVGGYNYLAEHFSLFYLLILPFYALWPGGGLFLVVGTVAYALTALPLFLLARDRLRSDAVAGAFALAFLMFPFAQHSVLFKFHDVQLIAPAVAFAFYYLVKKRWTGFIIASAFLLICREDTFLYMMMFGLFAAVHLRERRRGAAIIAASLLWGVLVLKVFMPYFGRDMRGTGECFEYMGCYAHMGDGVGGVLKTFVTHPGKVFSVIFSPGQMKFFCGMMAPLGFLSLLSGWGLLLAGPALAGLMLSNREAMYGLHGHWLIAILPFIFIAAVLGSQRLLRWRGAGRGGSREIEVRQWLLVLILWLGIAGACSLGSSWFPPDSEFSPGQYRISSCVRRAHGLLDALPGGSSFAGQYRYQAHVASRTGRLQNWEHFEPLAEDGADMAFADSGNFDSENLAVALASRRYGVAGYGYGFLLLERGAPTDRNDEVFVDLCTLVEAEETAHHVGRDVGGLRENDPAARFCPRGARPGFLVFGAGRVYPLGRYQARFRLRSGRYEGAEQIGVLDVTAGDGSRQLARRELRAGDCDPQGDYCEIILPFEVKSSENMRLELRVWASGKADLWVDRVRVESLDAGAGEFYRTRMGEKKWRRLKKLGR